MSETKPNLLDEKALVAAARGKVTVFDVFLQFLIIGATSFGGVVPYLRENLITKNHWVDDKEFVELLSISQSLPGLNATNMAVLLGDRLKGWMGAVAGIVGVCLPGAAIMLAVGIIYRSAWRPQLRDGHLERGSGGRSGAASGHGDSTRQEVAGTSV